MLRSVKIFFLIIPLAFVLSCNVTRLVPDGDALYTGASIKIKDSTLSANKKKKIVSMLEGIPSPKPNSKILGIRVKLLIYNMGGDTSKHNFIKKFLRKTGSPPVLLSKTNLGYNLKVLQNFLGNRGYFHASASAYTVTKKKSGHAFYTIEPGPAYTIQQIKFETDSSSLGAAIKATEGQTLLRPGNNYSLPVIKDERARIDANLKDKGYYYFSPDHLLIDADTTVGDHKVSLYLHEKTRIPSFAKRPYVIDDVYIFPNYQLNATKVDTAKNEKYLYDGYYIVDPKNKFKPRLFPPIMRFDSGELYSRTDHNITLSRLINLGVFKFAKNRFENSKNAEGDTGRLNAYYYLTPLPKKSLSGEISGNTKTDNSLGSEATVTFTDRNTFKEAEKLELHLNAGTEVQYSGGENGFNTNKWGAGATFTIPKFVVPFFRLNTTNAFVPKTKIDFNYAFLNKKKLYTLNSLSTQWGYVWKQNLRTTQEFNPIAINYVKALEVTQLFLDSIKKEPYLKHVIDTQFIIGSNYSYTLNSLISNPEGSGYYFNGLVDFSGNIAGLFVPVDQATGQKRLFNAPISQYLKGRVDARYFLAMSPSARLANRLILGFGYPYGNSTKMPFIKQFFSGGNNSLRAFRSQSVGPGTFRSPYADSTNYFADQSGDIKLEMNTELRLRFNKFIGGALFVDAGNVWLFRADTSQPGGEFTKNFMSQLAVGTGVGLRFDLSILILRFDLGMPIRKPWLPSGERWVFDQIDLGSGAWRKQNLILNIAIGYPF
jgi:outer membrane protein insertion porin family